jgi:hypothetical protein
VVKFHALEKVASIVPTIVFLGIYVPAAGHGFLSDDFRWLLNSRIESLADAVRLFRTTDGFYRPVVSLTFGVDRLLFGIEPRPYGWTNVGFALFAALLVRQLAIRLGLHRGAATLAASLWLLNFHGINLSILWVSGRTALVVTCAATACAIFIVRRRLVWALGCLALALLSKEEALTLPIVLASWMYLLDDDDVGARVKGVSRWLLASAVIVGAYLSLRWSTGAMTPATAPSYYQFTFAPAAVFRNALTYADRAVTLSMAAVLLGAILLVPKGVRLGRAARRTILCAGVWLVGGYGITLFLPVRSSLYCLVPSIGACLAAGVLLDAFWQGADRAHRFRALIAAIVLPICLIPVYRARTTSMPLADFSSHALGDIRDETRGLPDEAVVVVTDDRTVPLNAASAFGAMLNDAVLVETGRHLKMWIEPPIPGAELAGLKPPCGSCVRLQLRVVNGRVVGSP